MHNGNIEEHEEQAIHLYIIIERGPWCPEWSLLTANLM